MAKMFSNPGGYDHWNLPEIKFNDQPLKHWSYKVIKSIDIKEPNERSTPMQLRLVILSKYLNGTGVAR